MGGWLRWAWQSVYGFFRPVPASQIEPLLWMGPRPSLPLPAGVAAVLNVSEHQDDAELRIRCRYDWQPISDGPIFPGVEWLAARVHWITTSLAVGWGTLVHCTDGQSRSGLVIVAYLMASHGWSIEQALAAAQRARPVCRPNPAFLAGLRLWQEYLTGK